MNDSLAEQDLALLHALQIAPRSSWAELGRVLGVTSTALATRWERLRAAGLAWVTVHPGPRISDVTVAFVEVDVAPANRAAVIGALCRDSRAVTIEEAASGRDLVVTMMVPDGDWLMRFVLDELPALPGVQRVNTHLATEIHAEGSRWRLDALDREQQAALHSAARRVGGSGLPTIPGNYWPLVEALAHDGRRSAADMARIIGRNPATVRRQLARLLTSGLLSFRCEIAQVRSRWPVVCTWFAQVPVQELTRTVQSLTTLPELRLCASTTGETNLMIMVWARSPGDLMRLERLLSEKLPWLVLVESALMLRVPKRMGWVLAHDGRVTGEFVAPSPAHARTPHDSGDSREGASG